MQNRTIRVTDEAKAILQADPPPDALTQVLKTFEKWLYLPDDSMLKVLLGAVAANLMPGDPLWLLLVGPTGSGKTELLDPLPEFHVAGTGLIEERLPVGEVGAFEGRQEQRFFGHGRVSPSTR